MRKSASWGLVLLVLLAMTAAAGLALRPVFFRETLTVVTLLQRMYEDVPAAAFIDEGIQLGLEECSHRAGRFRLVEERRNVWPEMDTIAGLSEGADYAIHNPSVVALIGPSRHHGTAIARSLNAAGLLTISPDEREPEITRPGFGNSDTPECYQASRERTFFRTIPPDDGVERGAAQWCWKAGFRRVLCVGESFWFRHKHAFREESTRLGIQVVGVLTNEVFLRDAQLTFILERQPDLVDFGESDWGRIAPFLKELRKKGWKGRFLLREESAQSTLSGDDPIPDGMLVVTRSGPPADFVNRFTARYGRAPERAAYYGYQALHAVVQSIEKADSSSRTAIHRACADLPGFDDHGDPVRTDLDISEIRKGRLELLETFVPSAPAPDPPKPVLTISFDGGFENGMAFHTTPGERHGMTLTFFVDPAAIGTDEHFTWDDLRALSEKGNEIAPSLPATLPRTEWIRSLTAWKEAAVREHLSAGQGVAIPVTAGPVPEELRRSIADLGYSWMWGGPGAPFHSLPLEPGCHAAIDACRPLEKVEADIDRALQKHRHVNLRFRRIRENPKESDDVREEDCEALFNYVKDKGFIVVPARDVCRGSRWLESASGQAVLAPAPKK